MRTIYHIPNDDLSAARDAAVAAEAAGFDGIVALENAHGPFPPLAVAAMATERIELGTGVAIAFPRSPTVMAHAAWDLHKASNGRFHLGLGSQVKGHNERRYGIEWSPPAPRMRDYVGALRAVWHAWESLEPLDYRSDNYTLTLTTPNFSPKPSGLLPVPVSVAAVGPGMLRAAGRCADGVRLHPFNTRQYLEEQCLPQIESGLASAGRSRADIEVIAGAFIATGTNQAEVDEMLKYIRFRIAFYCSTRAYWHVLRVHDMQDLGERLRPYPAAGRWDEMAALIPRDVIDLFALVGTHDEVAEKLAGRYGGLVDAISLFIAPGTDPETLKPIVAAAKEVSVRFGAPRPGIRSTV
jgi:probable F420-dependent oxidoreductase